MNKAILQAIVDMIIKTGIPRILHKQYSSPTGYPLDRECLHF